MPPALSAMSAATLLLVGPAPVAVGVVSEPASVESSWSPSAFCVGWAAAGVEAPDTGVGVDEVNWLA